MKSAHRIRWLVSVTIFFIFILALAGKTFAQGVFSEKLNERIQKKKCGEEIRMNYDIIIHKIVGLGDEVYDERGYEEACKSAQAYLDKRYAGIIKFYPLESDYEENSNRSFYRRSCYVGGQYSCRFGGVYEERRIRKPEVTGNAVFKSDKFKDVFFEFPQLAGFKAEIKYNAQKRAAEIIYVDSQDAGYQFNPAIIIERFIDLSHPVSSDKILKNPQGVRYKIWGDHDCNSIEYYFKNIYMNMDTTVEFMISDVEVYQITTVNFIYNAIPEKEIFKTIINSFRVK